jgi:hypothetical protein
MGFFTTPTSYRLNAIAGNDVGHSVVGRTLSSFSLGLVRRANEHESHPAIGHLMLLVFEAVMEVVCVSLPGYIVARRGILDADKQKFLAELNVMLFTPALSTWIPADLEALLTVLVFNKLASQLTADKLLELAVIPVIFIVQTTVSYCVSIAVSKGFGFQKRPSNFVTAMGVSLLLSAARQMLINLGLRKLELSSDLPRHFAVTNIEGITLGQDTGRQ